MKKRNHILLITITLFSLLISCSESRYTSGQDEVPRSSFDDPVTEYDGDGNPLNEDFQTDHCKDINVRERIFHADLKSVYDRNAYTQLLMSQGICTNSSSSWQNYNGFDQYEQYGGTHQCSWWNRHGMKVYINFIKGYRKAAVVTIDATGDGWPQGGGQGFPTARMQFQNAVIDCDSENLTIYAQTQRGYLKISTPKDSGNKYSDSFRGSVSFNDKLISKGLFYIID